MRRNSCSGVQEVKIPPFQSHISLFLHLLAEESRRGFSSRCCWWPSSSPPTLPSSRWWFQTGARFLLLHLLLPTPLPHLTEGASRCIAVVSWVRILPSPPQLLHLSPPSPSQPKSGDRFWSEWYSRYTCLRSGQNFSFNKMQEIALKTPKVHRRRIKRCKKYRVNNIIVALDIQIWNFCTKSPKSCADTRPCFCDI